VQTNCIVPGWGISPCRQLTVNGTVRRLTVPFRWLTRPLDSHCRHEPCDVAISRQLRRTEIELSCDRSMRFTGALEYDDLN